MEVCLLQDMAVASSSSFEGMVVSVAKSRFCCDELKLAAASDLFRKIFTSVRYTGARHLFVELKNFPGGAPAFEKIIKFVEDEFQADHLDLHTSSFPTLCAAARYLGMPLLASSCARFWSSQVVTTTSSIFEVLAIVTQDHGVALSAEERSEVISKCSSATLQALGRSSLHEFFVNMVTILPVGGISVLLKFLERRVDFFSMQSKVWDKARHVVLASELIFVACPTGVKARDVLHRAGILARFVLGLFREGLDYSKEQSKHWLVPSFDDHHDLHESVALLNLLALCDFLLEQDSITADTSTSDRIKAQEKKLFALLAGSDAHSKASTILLSPGSAILLAFNFGKHHEDKKKLAVEFIEHYLQQISLTQLSREETLEICKFISAHSLSHDNLFNHVWRVVTRSTTLSRKRLQELMDTISSSKLSTETLLEKLQEVRVLSKRLQRKCSYCMDIPTSEEEEGDQSERESSGEEVEHQCSFTWEDDKHKKKRKKNRMWITVVAPQTSSSFSLMVSSNRKVESIEQKLKAKMGMPKEDACQLTYNDKLLRSNKRISECNISDFATLTIRNATKRPRVEEQPQARKILVTYQRRKN